MAEDGGYLLAGEDKDCPRRGWLNQGHETGMFPCALQVVGRELCVEGGFVLQITVNNRKEGVGEDLKCSK